MIPYYEHGGVTIYHGNCREVVPTLPRCDLLLTDPPYGIKMSYGVGGAGGFNGAVGSAIARRSYVDEWDIHRPAPDSFRMLLKAAPAAIIWGGNFFADLLPQATHWLVWDKCQTMPTFSDCELAWTNSERKSVKKFTVEWNGLLGKEDAREHPTQKPLELMKLCILGLFEAGPIDS